MKLFTRDFYCIAFFLFIIGIFFYPTFFQNKLPIPSDTLVGLYHPWRDLYSPEFPRGIPFKNFLITDPVRQQIPWRKIAIDEMKNGSLPRWNPYSFSGAPLIGNIQAGVFYPLNIFFMFLPFISAWTILIIMQPIMAGIFLYLYLRNLDFHPFSGLVSSIAWSLSGVFISWLTWGTIVHTALWLPFMLLSIDKVVALKKMQRKLVWIVLYGVSIIFSFFAGHTQIFLYIFILSVFYTLYRLRSKATAQRIRIGVLFISAIIIFSIVAYLQLNELIQVIGSSGRVAQENLVSKDGWFVPVRHLIQFLIPDFYGNPATLNYWGTWNYGELVGYIGIIPLILAGTGIIEKHKDKLFWMVVCISILLLIIPSPVAQIPFKFHIPFLSSLQPTRYMVLLVFSLIMFCAIGLDNLLKHNSRKSLSVIAIIGSTFYIAMFCILVIIGKQTAENEVLSHILISRRNTVLPLSLFFSGVAALFILRNKKFTLIGVIGILALLSFDLLRFGQKFTPFTDPSYFFPMTKIISYLSEQKKPFRVLAVDDRILPPNVSTYYEIESPAGYDPIYSRYYEAFVASNNEEKPISNTYDFNRIVIPKLSLSPLFPLFNIKYLLSLSKIDSPNVDLLMQEGETFLYAINDFLPRAFFVEHVEYEEDTTKVIQKLFTVDVKKIALVEEKISIARNPVSENETITFTEYTNDRFVLETNTLTEKFLVITNSFYPKWHAIIDNNVTSIYKTDGAFQGIVVPEGKHTITFFYE